MKERNIGIIGNGNIGSELSKAIVSQGGNVKFVLDSKRRYSDYGGLVSGLDGIFLAIPTVDDGRTAFEYIRSTIDLGVPIVTCEKGALSNYFSDDGYYCIPLCVKTCT